MLSISWRHRCGKQQDPFLHGRSGQDGIQIFFEAHIQHFIGFIEHQPADGGNIYLLALEHIQHAAGRGHDNLRSCSHLPDLGENIGAAVNWYNIQAFDMSGKMVEIIGYLQTKFSGGGQD